MVLGAGLLAEYGDPAALLHLGEPTVGSRTAATRTPTSTDPE
jgi:hypothetical protein